MKEAKTKQAAQEDRMPRREQTQGLMKTYIILKKKQLACLVSLQ